MTSPEDKKLNQDEMADERYFDIDSRWEALCFDELNDIEKQKLKSAAKSDPLLQQAQAGFEPLGSNFKVQIVDDIVAQLQGKKSQSQSENQQKNDDANDPLMQVEERAAVTSSSTNASPSRFDRLFKQWTARKLPAPILAAAACALVVFSLPWAGQEAVIPTIPGYEAQWPANVKEFRSTGDVEAAAIPRHSTDQRLLAILRPESAVEKALSLNAAIRREGEAWQMAETRIEKSSTGSFLVYWQNLEPVETETLYELKVYIQPQSEREVSGAEFLKQLNGDGFRQEHHDGYLLEYRYRLDAGDSG